MVFQNRLERMHSKTGKDILKQEKMFKNRREYSKTGKDVLKQNEII